MRNRNISKLTAGIFGSVILALSVTACTSVPAGTGQETGSAESYETIAEVPEYSGEPYVVLDDNDPGFSEEELTEDSYEEYSELDELGRCGEAKACIGEDLMPDEERGDISSVTPTGWVNHAYDNVDGEYVYNRCHLIGFQLTGENANEENLITGTRYMNTEGMLPFENMVAEYVTETENHVLYQVTPIFEGDNLVASGVQMQAESVEDGGEGICFNVYVYNVQPEITINYRTGENWETASAETEKTDTDGENAEVTDYIINEKSKKFHRPDCSGVKTMKEENKREYTGTRDELIRDGYDPCGTCKP